MRGRFSLAALTLGCALGLGIADASASDRPDPRAAIAQGEEGIRQYDLGRWDEAYLRFETAERLAHSPVFVLYMARSRRNGGKLLQARALYQKVVKESVPADAPEPLRKAPVEASAELDELERKIPSIVVVVTGAERERARIQIDRAAVPRALLTRPIKLDPGEHRIQAQVGSEAPVTKQVSLGAGADPLRVVLELGAGQKQPATQTPASESRGSVLPGAITLGIGIAGLGVGAVTGAIAAAKTSDIKERCVGVHCAPEDADEADRAKTLATVSTLSFAVGAAFTVGGVVLLITRPGASTQTAVTAGPGRVSFQARF